MQVHFNYKLTRMYATMCLTVLCRHMRKNWLSVAMPEDLSRLEMQVWTTMHCRAEGTQQNNKSRHNICTNKTAPNRTSSRTKDFRLGKDAEIKTPDPEPTLVQNWS